MLPSYGFDWPPVPDDIEVPLRKGNLKVDYAWGASVIGATPPPLERNVLWTFRLVGSTIQGIRNGLAPIEILTDSGIVEFGVAFDRDMFPVVVYKLRTGTHMLRYFDHAQNGYVAKALPGNAHSPRVAYDLKAKEADGIAEVVVGWFQGKDIYVAQSSKGYDNPRLAASYLQDLYLDQISFAANNRLRFIVYQLTRPEDLPEVNPVPQSKFSVFLYRRQYSGTNPPALPEDVVTFSSVGLKYLLGIKEENLEAEPVRSFPMSLCLRPEWVDEIIARNEEDEPILKITKTYTEGKDSETTLTLNQLTAKGGLVYDPTIKLYRSTFDHVTEGSNKRTLIVNITDLKVGESTTLVVDEDLKVKGDNRDIFRITDTPESLKPFMGSEALMTSNQFTLTGVNDVSERYSASIIDPPQWANESMMNFFPMLYIPKSIGISKVYVDGFTDPEAVLAVAYLYGLIPGTEFTTTEITRKLIEEGLNNWIVLVDGYYHLAMPIGFSVPSKVSNVGLKYVAMNEIATEKGLFLDANIRFSEQPLGFRRPSSLVENTNPLLPESAARDDLTESKYTYTFNASINTETNRAAYIDIKLPRAFFWPTELLTPDQYYSPQYKWTEARWEDGELYGQQELEHTVGFPINKLNGIEGNHYISLISIAEPTSGSGAKTVRSILKVERLVDGKVLEVEVNYNSP